MKVAPLKKSDDEVILKLSGSNLTMNTTCFCISSINPYIVIDKSFNAGGKLNYIPVQKTEISTSQSPNPTFKPLKFKTQALCNSDLNQVVQFKVYNMVEEGSPSVLIGSCQKSINFLVENRRVQLAAADGTPAGHLVIDDLQIIQKPTFFEYLRSGW